MMNSLQKGITMLVLLTGQGEERVEGVVNWIRAAPA